MTRLIKNISLLLCVVAAIASCHRKPLYDSCICVTTLSIPIDVDWEVSGVTPQNVTVLFYDSSDGTLQYEHTYEHNDNDIQSYVELPEGSYTAVIFNELRDQIDYVSCKDYENISTLKFESNDDDPLRSRTTTTTRSYVEQPGDLAVATVASIVVTEDMIVEAQYSVSDTKSDLSTATKTTVESLMGVVTKKKNATIIITAHIQNIYYARMPALVDIKNLSDGYYVFSDQNSSATSTIQFTMNGRTYYDETPQRNGYITATISTFGTLEDRFSTSAHDDSTPVMLDMLFQLIDADYTEASLEMDVTDYITFNEQSDGSVLMTINVELEEALPEVVPEGTEDSGFGSQLIDWSEVSVPLVME